MTTGTNKFGHFSEVELKICEEAFMLLRDCPELDSPATRVVLRDLFPQLKDAQSANHNSDTKSSEIPVVMPMPAPEDYQRTEIEKEFEAEFGKVLDYTRRTDCWGRAVYLHPHVESIYSGFKHAWLRATKRESGALSLREIEKLVHKEYTCRVDDAPNEAYRRLSSIGGICRKALSKIEGGTQ